MISKGISFLPKVDHVYEQAPFEEIDEVGYNMLADKIPFVNFNKLSEFEKRKIIQEVLTLACTGGSCEVTESMMLNSIENKMKLGLKIETHELITYMGTLTKRKKRIEELNEKVNELQQRVKSFPQ